MSPAEHAEPEPGRASRAFPGPNVPFEADRPVADVEVSLADERLYQCAVRAYLWAMPALTMWAMKERSEKLFGVGYHVLPIWKKPLSTRASAAQFRMDAVYAMGYLDLKRDGPLVIAVPPGLHGVLEDFFQRPIDSRGRIDGRSWSGDVGSSGPDRANGGNYLVLPPDFTGGVPADHLTFRSRTYGVFVFWRGFFKSPKQLAERVTVMERTRIYPLGATSSVRMRFPDASGVPLHVAAPRDGSAFDMLKRIIDAEYADPTDIDMRAMIASLGIVKGQPFSPHAQMRGLLDAAAQHASTVAKYTAVEVTATLPVEPRGFSRPMTASAGRDSPADVADTDVSHRCAFKDAEGSWLSGDLLYRMHLPADIPAKLFWSVTVYDPRTATGLDNGQLFPSINSMDRPAPNADGSVDIYFGPTRPRADRAWLATLPGKGFFVILRLYGATKAFHDRTWKPGDLERLR